MEKKKSPVPLRVISLILLLLWMGLIFCLSNQNAEESANVSGSVIKTVVTIIIPQADEVQVEKTVANIQFIVRKTAHFSIYGVLGILAFLTLVTYSSIPIALRSLLSFFISCLYSISDEYHQTFIDGRSGEARDVLIDSAGALAGIIFCLIIYSVRVSKMKKKQCIELAQELQKRLHNEKLKTEELQSENKALTTELSALNVELFSLRERLANLEQKSAPSDGNDAPSSEVAEEAVTEGFVAKPIEDETTDSAEETPIPEPELSPEIIDGAKIIGKIVLSSAEYCNKLTSLGADSSFKELVNLILGRTEVAKAEILRISALNIGQSEKQLAMERELNEAEDYFKSVMAQK